MPFTDEQYEALRDLFPTLSPQQQQEFLDSLENVVEDEAAAEARGDFLKFCEYVQPGFRVNWHHEILARELEQVEETENARLMINIMPRVGKSLVTSKLYPAWFMGRNPTYKVIVIAANDNLAMEFGQHTRDIIKSEAYGRVFPEIALHRSSDAKTRFDLQNGGSYKALGAQAQVIGFGADLLIIDDPHSDDHLLNPALQVKVTDWYRDKVRHRLQPGGRIAVIMSRVGIYDLCSYLLQHGEQTGIDIFRQVEIRPYEPDEETGEKVYLWPDFWKPDEVDALEAGMSPTKWAAMFMQKPMSEQSVAIPRERWMRWTLPFERDKLPRFDYIVQSWDTAYTEKTQNSASACTTWGAFRVREDEQEVTHLLLLDSYKDWLEFPELKRVVRGLYRRWKPDAVVIEEKATGKSLRQELRNMGIPTEKMTPNPGESKMARLAAVSDLFTGQRVWAPWNKEYEDWDAKIKEVIDQMEVGPGVNDDLLDSATQALTFFRKRRMVRTIMDENWKPKSRRVNNEVIYG